MAVDTVMANLTDKEYRRIYGNETVDHPQFREILEFVEQNKEELAGILGVPARYLDTPTIKEM